MIDLKKITDVFIDAAMERLTELENGLLQLEKSPHDKELINTIFRDVHSIKGSSGSIGLKEIYRFTHSMEDILNLVRLDKLAPGKELINLLLTAADMTREMVKSVASNTAFDFSRCEDLLKDMEDLKKRKFRIVFIPDPSIFKRGIDPTILIEDLRGIGEIIDIKAHTDVIPMLSDINPEDVYLRWDILLKTERDETEIKRVFEFVEEGSEIKIFPDTAPEGDIPLIGQMLVEEGIVDAEDVDEAIKIQKRLGEILVEQGKASIEDIERVVDKQSYRKGRSFNKYVSSSIRVDVRKLDHLVNIVGEMVIMHSMLRQALEGNNNGRGEGLDALFSRHLRIWNYIQESVMSLRMMPVGDVFQRLVRLVRELSESQNKEIELVITGKETELDKGILEKIADPLVHLIRNAIGHGIERHEERVSKGKNKKGRIHLNAHQKGDSVYIEIEDDGRGMDRAKILKRALSMGMIDSPAGLTDSQIYNLIFLPGFSTADKVTDVSGRGVGMDVVKRNIESLNGRVHIRTIPGEGTNISIKLPLTLAIIEGLTVAVGSEVFVIPVSLVIKSLRPDKRDVKTIHEKDEVIDAMGEYIPLLRLPDFLGITPLKKYPWEAIVIITSYEGKKYCILVDDLIGQQQIVMKNLGTAVPKVRGIAGGTILGNGMVAPILDVPGIVEGSLYARRY